MGRVTRQERTSAFISRCCSKPARRAIAEHVEDGHRDRRYRRRNTPQAAAAMPLTACGLPQGQRLEAITPHLLTQPAGASSQHGSRGSSTDHRSDDRCSATTLAADQSSETTGSIIRR